MKIISFEEMKRIELDMLLNVDDLCKKHDIKYYLGFGTLLGGVRHRGFIPWDDDIDILLFRNDYTKLVSLFNGGPIGNLSFLGYEKDHHSIYAFGKICDNRTEVVFEGIEDVPGLGVYIDVFPLDEFDLGIRGKINTIRIKLLTMMRVLSMHINSNCIDSKKVSTRALSKLLWGFSHIVGTNRIVSRLNKVAQEFNGNGSQYVACTTLNPKIMNRNIFGEPRYSEFEGHMLPFPQDADEYLRIQYGDYMILPPINERMPHHDFVARWKEG